MTDFYISTHFDTIFSVYSGGNLCQHFKINFTDMKSEVHFSRWQYVASLEHGPLKHWYLRGPYLEL